MNRQSILIVDDSMFTAAATKQMLSDKYNVSVASSGQECIKILEKHKPDLIIMDIQMPGMNGFETYEKIKQMGLEHIPVIFLTGNRDTRIVMHGLRSGAVDYIVKPVYPDVLRHRVETVLQRMAPPAAQEAPELNTTHLFEQQLTEEVTGLANENGLRLALDNMLTQKDKGPYVLVTMSIDRLMDVTGENADLRTDYAKALAAVLRSVPDAMPFRIDENTFALLFARATTSLAKQTCAAVQSAFVGSPVCMQNHALTLSFGGAVWDGDSEPRMLTELCAKALAEASKSGGSLSMYE